MAISQEIGDVQETIDLLDKFPRADDIVGLQFEKTWCTRFF